MAAEADDLGRLVGEALRSLRLPAAATGAAGTNASVDAGAAVEPPDFHGEGTALDGQLRVTATAGGRLESIHIDPRAMRTDSHTLAEQLLAAANAALAQVQEKLRAAVIGAGTDTAALADQLREVQETALPRMQSFLRSVEQLRQQAGGGAGG